MRGLIFATALLVGFSGAAHGREAVPAEVKKVYDGDTVTVMANHWVNQWAKTSVRLRGVDTPEIRGKCDEEKELAKAARDFVRKVIGKKVTLINVKNGKYAARVVANIRLADGSDLTELLIQKKLGRAYDGGKRQGWCG